MWNTSIEHSLLFHIHTMSCDMWQKIVEEIYICKVYGKSLLSTDDSRARIKTTSDASKVCVSMETFLSVNKEHAGPSRKKCDDKSFN